MDRRAEEDRIKLLRRQKLAEEDDRARRLAGWRTVPRLDRDRERLAAFERDIDLSEIRHVVGDAHRNRWLTTIAAITFYSYALIRRVRGSETLLILMTLLATRIGPGAVDLATLSGPQLWPALLLGLYQFAAGLFRCDSRRIFAALVLECGVMTHLLMLFGKMTPLPALAITALTLLAGMLVLGGIYQDEFAWLLRVSGAPLVLVAVICGLGTLLPTSNPYRWWTASTFTITLASIAAVYSVIVRMKLYQLSALMSSAAGFIGMAADGLMTLIRDSSWKGAASFSAGLFWFVLAVVISCWKAGWLRNSGTWITQMMRLENDHPPAT